MAKETTAHPVTGEVEVPRKLRKTAAAPSRRHEVLGVVTTLVALFLLLSLASYDGLDPDGIPVTGGNLIGMAGTWTAYFAFSLFGVASYLIDVFLWILASLMFLGRTSRVGPASILGTFAIGFLSAIALHTMLHGRTLLGGHAPGGFLGELFGELMISLVSVAGTYLVTLGGIVLVLLLVTDLSVVGVARFGASAAAVVARKSWGFGSQVVKAWKSAPREAPPAPEPARPPIRIAPRPGDGNESPVEERPAGNGPSSEPRIVTNKAPATKKKEKKAEAPLSPVQGEYKLPPLDLLASPPADAPGQVVDEEHLKRLADRLVAILGDFGVFGEVREIHPGPVVTMFEFQPRSGTKLSKIENLSSEIAMALEVMRVRVVAPIPGKNAVGFELPNKTRETVYLREMLSDDSFIHGKRKLPLSMGKDIIGNPYYVDLANMPHLLIAGTTGSGKSVSLNAMLMSLLYKYTPEDLRMLLVDPKQIELGIYQGIGHLLLPVVTDMSKACLALKWAVDEMERRYQLFHDLGVRHLLAYNAKVEKAKLAGEIAPAKEEPEVLEACTVVLDDGDENAPAPKPAPKLEKLPYIVIVIDELADLMMVAARDVETSIARLAQKARAAGIHLMIATQRPSVDVITGLIKANFPSRISFRVSSVHDSRTILNAGGAENLLGQGDMLIIPPGTSDLTRVHGAFVDDDEIKNVVEFLKAQGAPRYETEILKPREDESGSGVDEDEKDEVYDQAVALVAEKGECSISMIQRHLRIGYNRSARLVEIMEKEGIVGPPNGVNRREVLISPQ
jgi:DNA segregation ATPase FtsK/SpoIIIE, S-DNA-T family